MRFELEFEDTFESGALDPARWLPYYLPHWSSRERAAARYAVGGGALRLLIEEDQQPWCPELDGELKVSSLQTGLFAGPVGSTVGQHRFHPAAVVREAQPNVRLYTPRYGRIELRARFGDDPRTMVALWLIGYEDEPERSAEICVCEIFGRDVGADETAVGLGLHPFGDPAHRRRLLAGSTCRSTPASRTSTRRSGRRTASRSSSTASSSRPSISRPAIRCS